MHTDLWNFALNLYAKPGVEAACLRLQHQGADVCLLLCAAWLDSRGVAREDSRVAQLQQIAIPWQKEVVQPLRALRQQWRQNAQGDAELAALRERLKQLELEAERALLERLQRTCEHWSGKAPGVEQNWLEALTPSRVRLHHDALHVLRVAAKLTQDGVEGD